MSVLVFLAFLAGAALGGLAGYALGACTSPRGYWQPYYYQPNYYYPTPSYQPYYYQPCQTYVRPYGWHPWYGYW